MHKQDATKLLKEHNNYLLMVTFQYSENCLLQFEISNNGPLFVLIQNEKHYLHSTKFGRQVNW